MKLAIPKLPAAVITLVSAVHADVTKYKAATDDRSSIEGHGYSKSGETETFLIAAADRKIGQRLTPRVEREYRGEGLIRRDKGVYTFSATYKIDAANNTTIIQLLNHFPGTKDPHRIHVTKAIYAFDSTGKLSN